MVKPKKGKSNIDDDFDDDDDTMAEQMAEKDDDDLPKGPAPAKKDKKKKKGKGKGDDEDWDELESKVKTLSLDANGDDEDDSPAPAKNKKKDKKPKGVSAFELLGNMEDDDDDGGNDMDGKESEDEVKKEDVEQSKSKKKEKKKKEKPKKVEDDDIDAILADLDKPAAKAEKKKGKKKNKQDEDVDDIATTEEVEAGTPTDAVNESKVVTIDDLDEEYENEKKKKKKKKKQKEGGEADAEQAKEVEGDEEQNEDDDGGTVKSAAQKKKEKKEREKQKKAQEKQKVKSKATAKDEDIGENEVEDSGKVSVKTEDASHEATPEAGEEDGEDKGKKKKKKKGDKEKDKDKEEKEKPVKVNKKLAALKEHLQKVKEEEQKKKDEDAKFEEQETERIRQLEEQKRLEEERKKRKKQQKKEREDRLKKEGKFLTEKQKQDKRRLEQMLEAMKASGMELPSKEDVPRKRPVYGKKKKTQGDQGDQDKSPSPVPTSPTEEEASSVITEVKEVAAVSKTKVAEEDVKDEWDAESEEEAEEAEEEKPSAAPTVVTQSDKKPAEAESDQEEEDSDEEDEDDDDEEEESSEESESESDDDMTPIEKGRDKIQKRAEKADKLRTTDHLRAPVVCVLGHVDTGKTKILDKLRRTNVQDGEAGGITQQIGATNVPKEAILEKTKMIKEFTKQELKLPGLLIIDTPGHESFSNLRLRGSSLCDIAILVIDIMHGLEPQTIESINLLKERKTPFIVALNKIDRLYNWKPQPMADVMNTIKKQQVNTKAEFDERAQHVIVQLAEEGLNSALYYENKNPKEYISLVPTSAHSGDGMGSLVALVCDYCQNRLTKRLMYSQELQATVMEVKAIQGMGTTIDVILINGCLNEGDTVVLAGTEGPIVTQIRGLLMPQPMKELRVKSQYEHHKTVLAAQGVKINAKDMERALAGLPLYVANDNDEKEYYRDEVATVLKETLESIKVQERGVFVQASTLGSLEALLEFLRTSKIPYAGINIGPVHKKDIMRASVMLEHDSQYAVILAFDVKVEREANDLAEYLGVRIFTADIIYHLFDAFTKYRADLKKQKQEEFKHVAVFPCKLRVLPQFIFNSRDPIVMGVSVEAGFLKEGTPICVPSKEFVEIGRVGSLELNHKQIETARQGQEICIKIVPSPGDAPKMYGRHFDETDMLVSKITRQSIDVVKDYFREEMTKPDWKLIMELKKQFEIL